MGPRQALPKLINSAFSGLFQREPFHKLFRSGIIDSFRRYDRELAWPDAEFFIENAPPKIWGGVGGDSYTGWIYQQGFFAALIKTYLPGPSLRMIDFGCGFGKLAPVSTFFTQPSGLYLGVDIRSDCIQTCKLQYPHLPRVEFHLSKDYNAMYSERRSDELERSTPQHDWPVAPGSIDLVTSVSVFTHLQEAQALHYMKQIHGVLKPGGFAMLTFHIVAEPRKTPKFTSSAKAHLLDLFDFKTPLPPSKNFFTSTPEIPENAIAVNDAGLRFLIGDRFELVTIIRGSTTGGEDPFFQDVVILKKKHA